MIYNKELNNEVREKIRGKQQCAKFKIIIREIIASTVRVKRTNRIIRFLRWILVEILGLAGDMGTEERIGRDR